MGLLSNALGRDPRPSAIVALGAIVLFASAVVRTRPWYSGCRSAPPGKKEVLRAAMVVESFAEERGRCPAAVELGRLGALAIDPWGTPIAVACAANLAVEAVSAGPDRAWGTPDDVRSDG